MLDECKAYEERRHLGWSEIGPANNIATPKPRATLSSHFRCLVKCEHSTTSHAHISADALLWSPTGTLGLSRSLHCSLADTDRCTSRCLRATGAQTFKNSVFNVTEWLDTGIRYSGVLLLLCCTGQHCRLQLVTRQQQQPRHGSSWSLYCFASY